MKLLSEKYEREQIEWNQRAFISSHPHMKSMMNIYPGINIFTGWKPIQSDVIGFLRLFYVHR